MTPTNLKKGQNYYYTAGAKPVRVLYKYETINGYMFSFGGVDRVLPSVTVKHKIEKL